MMPPVTIAGIPIGDGKLCTCGCGQLLVTTSKERGYSKEKL